MPDTASQDHSEALNRARQEKPSPVNNAAAAPAKNPVRQIENIKKALTPASFFSALRQASLLKDMPFVCAFGFAILKDILDLLFNETVILGFLFSILCTIFIVMMMFLAGAGKKRKTASKFITKGIVLISGGVADSVPGLGFLPIETLTVFIIYVLVLQERAEAENI